MKKIILLSTFVIFSISLFAQKDCESKAKDTAVNALVKKVDETLFDEGKVNLITDFLKQNCVNSTQSVNIIQQLNFEEDRIVVIKKLYPRLIDKNNLELILSVLEFNTSRKEIVAFVEELKKQP